MTLAKMAKHASELDELDVEGILAFAERVLPRASDLWIQASLAQRQQLQKLFFPDGILFDENAIVRTPPRPSAFSWLEAFRPGEKGVVDHSYASSNRLVQWLDALKHLRSAAANLSPAPPSKASLRSSIRMVNRACGLGGPHNSRARGSTMCAPTRDMARARCAGIRYSPSSPC
jgi:hypothetical protein